MGTSVLSDMSVAPEPGYGDILIAAVIRINSTDRRQ
jgi:hypothetical protein